MNSEEYKKQVEAVLFTVGRPLTTQEISELLNLGSQGMVKKALSQLLEDYKGKDSALEILQDGEKYRMNIKGEHLHLVQNLMPVTELDKPTMETLAIIAWKHPVLQSDVVKMRGNKTYEHMKVLVENEFVTTIPTGLSKTIRLAPKFFQYFDTNKNQIQKQLDEEASKKEMPELPQPGPASLPSDEMPQVPGKDVSPGDVQLDKEETKKKEDV